MNRLIPKKKLEHKSDLFPAFLHPVIIAKSEKKHILRVCFFRFL